MNELALFAGAGGGILGGKLLGWRTICAVEIDTYAASVLVARQNDGCLEPFPIWDDVRTFNGKEWRGRVDVISGGFPCQDISFAGKRAGITGKESGLWTEFARIIREVRSQFVFVENSGRLITSGIEVVLADLAAMGYAAAWGVFRAYDVGASHKRERAFIVAHACKQRKEDSGRSERFGRRISRIRKAGENGWQRNSFDDGKWPAEPSVERVFPHGVAYALDRHHAIGNGQVPRVVALAWQTLTQELYIRGCYDK